MIKTTSNEVVSFLYFYLEILNINNKLLIASSNLLEGYIG